LGLGLNVSWSPEGVDFPATDLQAECGQTIDRARLLRALLARMEMWYAALTTAALFDTWRARLVWLGQPIVIRAPEGELHGHAEDVEEDGALRVRLTSGEARRVLAGDVHLRPARG
jgi:BirA family biotin operon repressor/biotin-[acetyl-CoA-carboxylase] ligase